MNAIRVHQFGGPEVMKIESLPDPTPTEKQLLIRIGAAGVNPVETYVRSGAYAAKPNLPYTPGSDGAGTIEAIGPGVAGWKAGDRVYVHRVAAGYGTYASHVLCDVAGVGPLPARLSFAQGAALGVPYGTAYRALFHRAKVRPGETVLIHGATGGVGLAAVQLAVAHGCIVCGTGGTPAGRELVKKQGVMHVLDHRAPDYLNELARLTDGIGFNAIIEMLANVNLDEDLGLLARHGRVVIVGSRGRIEIDPRQTMGKESAILGMTLWGDGDTAIAEAHHAISAGLCNETLTPIIDCEYALTDASQAHQDVMSEGSAGKIVLIP